jgi:hypothetical protein
MKMYSRAGELSGGKSRTGGGRRAPRKWRKRVDAVSPTGLFSWQQVSISPRRKHLGICSAFVRRSFGARSALVRRSFGARSA